VSAWREKWQRRYAERAFLFGREPNAFLVAQAWRMPPGARVLCAGEGEGRNAVWLAQRGHAVTAVDFAPTALARAAALAEAASVAITCIEADLSRWAWPAAAFDAVVMTFVQLTADDRVPVHAGAVRALAPGGLLLLEAFAQGERLACGPPTDDARYAPAMLREDFAALVVVELLSGTVMLAEGEGHRGEANVVRLLASRRLVAFSESSGRTT
jgi:SAM-dependent methyltransferase